jgi:predicted AAA+ superfamily ATPase
MPVSSFRFAIHREGEAQALLWHGKRDRRSHRMIWQWNQVPSDAGSKSSV